jgi:hypothetical protein
LAIDSQPEKGLLEIASGRRQKSFPTSATQQQKNKSKIKKEKEKTIS